MTNWPIYPGAADGVPQERAGNQGLTDQRGQFESATGVGPVPASYQPSGSELAQKIASRGQTSDNPMIFAGGGDTLRKTGEWLVPPFIRIIGGMGTVFVDMQRAQASRSMISVEVAGGLGEIVIVIPEGWGADAATVASTWATRKIRVDGMPSPNVPFLYVTGTLSLGSLTIRYPTKRDLKRKEKEIREEQRRLGETYR